MAITVAGTAGMTTRMVWRMMMMMRRMMMVT